MFNKDNLTWKGVALKDLNMIEIGDAERGELFGAVADAEGDFPGEMWLDLFTRFNIESLDEYASYIEDGARFGDKNPLLLWHVIDGESSPFFPERFLPIDFSIIVDRLCEDAADNPQDTECRDAAIRMRDALKEQVAALDRAIAKTEAN